MKDERRLSFCCPCGAAFRITPREVPLAKDEVILCDCGRVLEDRHSTRYFDYEKIE